MYRTVPQHIPRVARRASVRRLAANVRSQRSLRFEPLEERRLLAITVNSLTDEADGSIVDGDVSLRDAIIAAPAGETINFAPALTSGGPAQIMLTLGELTLTKPVTISGPGANLLSINAQGNSRVLSIDDGRTARIDATITGLTLTGGSVTGFLPGAGIRNNENLTLTGMAITQNSASFLGGAIWNGQGNLTISQSTISGNSASHGGGIFSSVSPAADQETLIINSTISGNSAAVAGGGIFNADGDVIIRHSTITGNSAPAGRGAGIAAYGFTEPHVLVISSIVAGNTASDIDFFGGNGTSSVLSDGYNLVGTGTAASAFSMPGDQMGVANPQLGPLANNGGPTRTHAVLLTSPALNAGDPDAVGGMNDVPAFDQRGSGFPRVRNGRIDIGAFESDFFVNDNFVVDTLVDERDENFSPGDLSLREAILLANLDDDLQTITFAPALTSGGAAKINLALGELAIASPVTINGPGANLLSIDAVSNSRIFSVDDGSAILISVALSGLTLTGGDVKGVSDGGAIVNRESLIIANCVISGNEAVGGGGIYSRDGNLTITSSTINGNSASLYGGGIFSSNGNLTITDSTLSGNSASGGGAIASDTNLTTQTTTLTNSTISGNTATVRGGGLLNLDGLTVLRHSTLTSNSAPAARGSGVASYGTASTRTDVHSTIIAGNTNSDVDIVNGPSNSLMSLGYNLIGTGSDSGAFNAQGDLTGVVNPRLGPLAENGGPTRTHALLLDSPAINAGDPAAMASIGGVPTFDQRGSGFPRVIYDRIDIGAFESPFVISPNAVVDTIVDEVDENFAPGDLSLREAILLANLDDDLQTITFVPALTSGGAAKINLALGELAIASPVTINGPGANLLSIDAVSNSRIFSIDDGSAILISVALSGLTLTGGDVKGVSDGGAIVNRESLIIANCVISGNEAVGGGGIYSRDGNLTITSSTINGNSASLYGGGIFSSNGNLTITDSTLSGNSASGGGAIASDTNLTTQTTTLTNSTISGNTATVRGGGLLNLDGLTVLRHSTLTANSATTGNGSGVASIANTSTRTDVHSTIIAGNTNSDVDFVTGTTNSLMSLGYNLIGTGNAASAFNAPGDLTGVVNPRLGPLAENGGPTKTHALLLDSPAMNAGNPAAVAGVAGVPAFDQRGSGFLRVRNGRIDIGAFELNFVIGPNLVVDTLVDEADGSFAPGDFSLREAINLANTNADLQTITFAPALTSGGPAKINLALGELAIASAVTLNGPGAHLLSIDAAGNSRVLTVDNGDNGNAVNVQLVGLTITGGRVSGFNYGGGILNRENLTISASTVAGNSSSFLGGGIWIGFGNLTIVDSTISGNSASHGGGILSNTNLTTRTTTISGSTISGNSATIGGGGMLNTGGLAVIRHSTITSNTAPNAGGSGIASYGNNLTRTEVNSTIIAGNTNSDVDLFGGNNTNSFTSLGYNLVGTGTAVTAFTNNDLTGVTDPRLVPLASNGGPTMTHTLAANSPALNAGDPNAIAGVAGVPAFDQRGNGFLRIVNGRIDIGALEAQAVIPALAGDYNEDGTVDAADYVVWRKANGSLVPPFTGADGDGNGVVNQADLVLWRANFGNALPMAAGTSAIVPPDSPTAPVAAIVIDGDVRDQSVFRPASEMRSANRVDHQAQSVVTGSTFTGFTSAGISVPNARVAEPTFAQQQDDLLAALFALNRNDGQCDEPDRASIPATFDASDDDDEAHTALDQAFALYRHGLLTA